MQLLAGSGRRRLLHLLVLLEAQAGQDLRGRAARGLQRPGHGAAPGRPGRELPHVRLSQRPTPDHEGQLLGQGGRPARHQG